MTDEGGVLGNLPNSRPGRRSAKRDRASAKRDRTAKAADRPADAASKAAARAEAGDKPAAKPARAAKQTQAARPRRRTTAVKGGGSGDGVDVMHDMDAQRRHDSPGGASGGSAGDASGSPGGASGDPLGAVVRTAAGLAVTGVKVGGAVTKELLRRLPRP